ncbi:acetolactate synthase large subunit [Rhizobium leguminosarum]|uniref:acetolactate synthase large subunit n=2 Tax=Rhizobium leguminosarum TaxID=384 RepID=UPI001C96E62F|nr:acetolactate synthase large subunit [Rhizobium leguminosarum]MBY5639897.1 acetolactate synthase large subunit [Rhizobium leguminosarum]MBY5728660.1 acetolactate synthase large subunit [Rhizobium leguminosarum]
MIKGSDILVRALENEGVDCIFGIPGEETLDFLESLRKSKKIKFVPTRHEQGAIYMAANYARLTGKPAVCLATLGPGMLNFCNGAGYAQLNGMPLVLIAGQKAIKNRPQAGFQRVDAVATMKPLTKFAMQIASPEMIPPTVSEAFRIAQEGKKGPVYIELPEDIAAEKCEEVALIAPHKRELPIANDAALDRAAALITAAKRPLLVFGAAAPRRAASCPGLIAVMEQFVNRTGIPFFTTQMGKGAVSEDSHLYMGTAALSEGDYVHDAVDKADLIITIGHDTTEKPPFLMGPKGREVIHIGDQSPPVEQVYFPQSEVIGDIGHSLKALADRLEGKLPNARALLPLREEILSRTSDGADDASWPITPDRLVHEVRKSMGEKDIVALDNGQYKLAFARSYRTNHPNTLLLDNELATMGAGLPSAMMAAMLNPERRVIAVCGDGGFLMTSQEIETALRLMVNLVVLILVDGSYGMIGWKQAARGFPDFGISFGNPDFVKLAEAYGAKGTRVETLDDLVPALEAAFEGGGVHLVEVPIDYRIDELRSGKAKPPSA